MKLLTELDSLDNVKDGETRKLVTKATSSGSGNVVSSVSVSGDTITYTKGVTALTAHQNAFSTVKVGSTNVAADQAGDTLELVAGSNVTLTPDATNDKVTIAATDTTYENKAAASGGTAVSLVTTGEKYTWNNKQNALSTQTAYSAKGTATKVPQITTNTLGQVTKIEEVTITQPTVNNGTLTIQKNGTNVQTFSANQSGNATANITVPTKTSDLTNDSNYITNTGSTSGNAGTATKLQTARTIGLGTGATGTATNFDGSSNITIPVTDMKEAYVTWGGRSIASDITPVDMGCIDEFGHNKLAYLPAACIDVKYSTDGGSTWTDYGLTDTNKINMVTTQGPSVYIGGPSITPTAENIANLRLRVRIACGTSALGGKLYTAAKKMLINYSTQGSGGNKVALRYRTIANYVAGTETWTNAGTYDVNGGSGWNSIPFAYTFGGYFDSQTDHIGEFEFLFYCTSLGTWGNKKPCVIDFRLIGSTNWITPSEIARAGHLYTIDTDQNASFPASIITPKNDNMGIIPNTNNYGQIGSSSKYFYRSYINNYYGDKSHINYWDAGKNIGTAATSSAAATKGTVNFINDCAASGTQTKTLLSANTTTSNITVTLPNQTGTLALTSAIPTAVSQLTNDSGYTTNTGTITKVQANGTDVASSGTANIPAASTGAYGVTKLSSATDSTSEALAATPKAVKTAYDLAASKGTGTITGVSVNGTSVATSGVANITSVPASILSGAIPSAVTATTQNQGDSSTKIATTAYVDTAIDNLPEPMVFKGSLGTGGTITALPVDGSATIGDTYKVITAGTYASKSAKVGDTFICLTKTSSANTWELIPSGDEPAGTVTSITIKGSSPITVDNESAITSSGTRTISHANSGVTAGTYKSVTVNATGHVTAGSNPTTIAGYGITDAKIASGVITLGSNTITPLTADSTLNAAKLSGTIPSGCYTNTKNTAGSTDSSSKLFLVGATEQSANPQTYSQDTAYVGTDGHLYSNSVQVVNLSGSQALTNKTYNGYTLAAACAKAVVTSIDTSASLPTSNAVKTFVEGKNYNYSVDATVTNGTIDDLAVYTSGKPGMTGSINITKKSSGIGSEIASGWYNFIFSPHRTGSGGDNISYGNIILMPMTSSGTSYILRRSSSTTTISEVKPIITTDTKNTAGSTDTSSKIYLIGATSQAANPQTYSDNEVYATSGVLTTKSVQVGGTAATMQYNSTDKCIEFVFA